MTKYRIRLENGRVIGPFDKAQLFDLKTKGHIKGGEEAQVFPMGNWGPISTFDFYPELMDEDRTVIESKSEKDETFVIDLNELRNKQNEKELEAMTDSPLAPIEELTETLQISNTEAKKNLSGSLDKNKTDITPALFEIELDNEKEEYSDRQDKTLINPVAQQEISKMRRVQKSLEEKQKAEELEKEKQKKIEEEKLKAQVEAEKYPIEVAKETLPVSPSEPTQMFKIDQANLMELADENEQGIEEELKELKRQRALDGSDDDDDEEAEPTSIIKRVIYLILAVGALTYAIGFPDKPKAPPFQHLEPKIVFPIPYDVSDPQKSKAAFARGIEYFNKGSYPALIRAGLSFKESYENDLDNVDALNFLVRTYAEEIKHSKSKLNDEQTVFNLIQSKRPYLAQDPNGVIGLNLFYMAINKTDAAIDVVQKYLKIKPNEVTQDLFAVYLLSLIKRGKIDLARQFFQALDKTPAKNRYAYKGLIEYFILNQEREKAMEYVDEAILKNPQDVTFLLTKSELLIEEGKIKEAIPFIKKAAAKNYDYNNLNRAKYLELKGMIYAYDKKIQKATSYFAKSLQLADSVSLRMNLAKLESTAGFSAETDKLINESKAIKLLLQAKDFYQKKNYELAMSLAARASDAFPGHIPSELFLAKVQLKLGLAEYSLKTLSELASKYPDDKVINLSLVEAYIDMYKFNEAKNRIQIISNSEYRDSAEYASINAKLYLQMGDKLQAMSWLKHSITLNPLNDEDIFTLAELLLRKAHFDAARSLLNKCMELDPVNPDYRIAYAKLIYETQDDMAAIGYLLSLQDEFGDNPKILSEIAIFYYRAGKVKDFQDYKAKLEKNHASDKSLYEFLIKAAMLDERYKDIPPLVEKLLAIEPGDLQSMMTAGKVLFENGKLVEAAKWFKRVEDKLPSYPKVLYYQAKIDYLAGDSGEAEKKILQNIKENGENDTDLVLLAQIKENKEEFIEAENLYKKAQKLNPKSFEAIIGLADLSTKRNNHDLALNLYKSAMRIRSDEPIVHKKIGDVYRRLGQGTLAIEAYKLYLEMDPESSHKKNLEAYIKLMK
jgi:tetratricopeptide (TPR) repeat protein